MTDTNTVYKYNVTSYKVEDEATFEEVFDVYNNQFNEEWRNNWPGTTSRNLKLCDVLEALREYEREGIDWHQEYRLNHEHEW
jgi:hypothetical protein